MWIGGVENNNNINSFRRLPRNKPIFNTGLMMFKEIPASVVIVRNRAKVLGYGTNNANYKTKHCPIYKIWRKMLFHNVCEEWRIFTNFKDWIENKKYMGTDIYLDLLLPKTAEHSPLNSYLLPNALMEIFREDTKTKGYCEDKTRTKNKYKVSITSLLKRQHIGYFATPELARKAYLEARIKYLTEIAQMQPERIKQGLLKLIHERFNLSNYIYQELS